MTRITYELDQPQEIDLGVFDTLGRRIATLARGHHEAGTKQELFDGSDLASGVYVCRLSAGGRRDTMSIMKSE